MYPTIGAAACFNVFVKFRQSSTISKKLFQFFFLSVSARSQKLCLEPVFRAGRSSSIFKGILSLLQKSLKALGPLDLPPSSLPGQIFVFISSSIKYCKSSSGCASAIVNQRRAGRRNAASGSLLPRIREKMGSDPVRSELVLQV